MPEGRGSAGQSSVEAMLVMLATIMVAGTLALLWHASQDGRISHIAVMSASHTFGSGLVDALKDIALY